jgi:hypothetical protein
MNDAAPRASALRDRHLLQDARRDSRCFRNPIPHIRMPPTPPHLTQQAPRYTAAYSTLSSEQQQWGPPDTLSAEDRFAILDLCHRFDLAINAGQQHTLGQFFTADAEVHHPKVTECFTALHFGALRGLGIHSLSKRTAAWSVGLVTTRAKPPASHAPLLKPTHHQPNDPTGLRQGRRRPGRVLQGL